MSSPLNLPAEGNDGTEPIGTPEPSAPVTEPYVPPAGAPPTPAMPDFGSWRSSLDPELRDQPSIANIESFEGLVREHANVQKFIGGDKISKPAADAPQEDWDRFYGAMGRPDQADGYNLDGFKTPENVPWDKEFQDHMVGVLHKHGVSQREMAGILQDYADVQGERYNQSRAQHQAYTDESANALRQEWGGAFDSNIDLAEGAFKKTFGEDMDTIAHAVLPDGTPIGDHPIFMKAFFRIGKEMREHGLIGDPGRRVTPVMTPSEAKLRIKQLESDPEFRSIMADPAAVSHPKRVEWNQLYDYAEGDAV